MSAVISHLRLPDRVVSKVVRVRLNDGLVVCDLEHGRRVAALCMVCKFRCNPDYAL